MKKTCLTLIAYFLLASVAAFAQTHQVNLTWVAGAPQTPPCTVAETNNLYRATAAGQEGATPFRTGLSGTAFVDNTVLDGLTYFYKLSAVCSTDTVTPESTLTAEVTAIIPAGRAPGPPPPPVSFSGTITTLGASLIWNAVPDVTAYDLFKTGPAQGKWHYLGTTNGTTFLDTTAKAKGATYQYFVASSDGTTDGAPSATVTLRHP